MVKSSYGIKLRGIGYSVPTQKITNDDLAKIVDTSDEWIVTRTGIKSRHISGGTPIYKFGVTAAKKALEDASLTIDDIDYIICTTLAGDFVTPSAATCIAHDLGVKNDIPCVDINAACAGFVYGLDMAHKYLSDDKFKNILVVSAESLSKFVNFEDRATCVLFGDGAGAAIVSRSKGFYSAVLGSKTDGLDKIMATGIRYNHPFMVADEQTIDDMHPEQKGNTLSMDGKDVYKFATSIMPYAVRETIKDTDYGVDDISLIIPHQANVRIIETATKNLGVLSEKVYANIEKYGNTSSASIAIGLSEVVQAGKVKLGELINLVGFGAGLVFASCTFEY